MLDKKHKKESWKKLCLVWFAIANVCIAIILCTIYWG